MSNKFSLRVIAVSVFAFFYTFTRQTFLPCLKLIQLPDINNGNNFFCGSNISSYFGLVYALVQIPYGILLDKLGVNYFVSVLTALMSSGFFICALSTSTSMFFLGRIITVLGCGGAFISIVKTSNMDLGHKTTKSFVGYLITFALIFGVFFINYFSQLLYNINNGWRFLYGFQGIIIALLFLYFMTNRKNNITNENQEKVNFFDCLTIIKQNPRMLLIIFFSLIFFMIFYSINETTLMADLLNSQLSLPQNRTFSILLIGFLLGFSTTPMTYKPFGHIKYTILLCLTLIGLSLAMIYIPNIILSQIFLFMIGYSNGMQMILIEMANEEIPKAYSGMVAGIMNVLFVGGCFLSQQFLFFITPKLSMGSSFIFYFVIIISILSMIIMNAIGYKNNKD